MNYNVYKFSWFNYTFTFWKLLLFNFSLRWTSSLLSPHICHKDMAWGEFIVMRHGSGNKLKQFWNNMYCRSQFNYRAQQGNNVKSLSGSFFTHTFLLIPTVQWKYQRILDQKLKWTRDENDDLNLHNYIFLYGKRVILSSKP